MNLHKKIIKREEVPVLNISGSVFEPRKYWISDN